jgi:hypothetical protein
LKKKNSFWAQKTHFRAERHENKENLPIYFGVRILLTIQIQLLDIENPKYPKINSFYCTVIRDTGAQRYRMAKD